MKSKIDEVKQLLMEFKQEHLLRFIDKLPDASCEKLIAQITAIDFKLMKDLYDSTLEANKIMPFAERNITPVHCDTLNSFSKSRLAEYMRAGANTIREGRVAAVTMAGGQGTRLGYNGPKGTFYIGAPIGKTLFQLQAERLKAISRKYGKCIPWYIMTSSDNYNDTMNYFEAGKYFNYPRNDVFFFKQGMLPMIDFEGKVLLKENDEICFGPDGNGGVFLSLKKSGALQDMDRRGIEWVFVCGIDNALVKMADPVFIGYAMMSDKSAASKSVLKKYPEERVGVFCLENARPSIVEYTELTEEFINMTDTDGQLLFGDANIISHLFRLKDLNRIADNGLQYHAAVKKASYINQSGQKADPEEPNAYKFESFVFDAFRNLDDMAVLRVQRDKEFAPIKNCAGEDSPETAKRLLLSAENLEWHDQ